MRSWKSFSTKSNSWLPKVTWGARLQRAPQVTAADADPFQRLDPLAPPPVQNGSQLVAEHLGEHVTFSVF
jgi:hypothetical protein